MTHDPLPYKVTRQLRDSAGALLGLYTDADTGQQGFAATLGEGHRIVVGPPGSGKFTSCIAPLLLLADAASVIVFDVKNGEAARTTARHRRTGNKPLLVLDPFKVSGLPSGAINPLDILQKDDPFILEKAAQLADAIFVVAQGVADADYWNDQARAALVALLLHVATSPYEKDRTLKRVRKLIRLPWMDKEKFGPIWTAMQDNPVADNIVSDLADNMVANLHSDMAKNVGYIQQSLYANTGFLDYPSMQETTARTSLDLSLLRRQVGTLYVCLPEEHIETAKRWLRMIYIVVMLQVKTAAKDAVPLHFVMDEFPALGKFPRVQRDMNLVRSLGIHMHIVTQSLVQLKALYGDGWETFAAASKFLQVLGANDLITQQYVSNRLGTHEQAKTTKGVSMGRGGQSESRNTGTERVPVLDPAQVGLMPRNETIVIMEATQPLWLQKVHYFDNDTLEQRADKPPRSS